MNNIKPSRGEIWFVDLNPIIGHEQAKIRPCLILSNNTFNHGPAQLHSVLPITSKQKDNPLYVPVKLSEGVLEIPSFILCDQIRTVSRKRFRGKSLGIVSHETINTVEHMIRIILDL